MENVQARLTIVFEEGFWIGYFERSAGGEYRAARHVFWSEPGLAELKEFLLSRDYDRLVWTRSRPADLAREARVNPKRRSREIARSQREGVVASKARQAVQAEYETRKSERKSARARIRGEVREERFQERREKRKRKLRGH